MSLLSEKLFCCALSTDYVGKFCQWCLQPGDNLKRCTSCKMIVYCGRSCQESDWPEHRPECAAITKHDGIMDDGVRLVMRMSVKWQKNMKGAEHTERSLETIEDHYTSERFRNRAQEWLNDYKQYAVKKTVDDEVLKRLYCKMSVNSFAVSDQFGKYIGIGLCLQLSAIDHSCAPAARIAYKGREAIMAPTSSYVNAIETAQHSYIDELQHRDDRRKELKEKYNFDCDCVGCRDEVRNTKMEGFECPLCRGCVGREIGDQCLSCDYRLRDDCQQAGKMAEEMAKAGCKALKRTDISTKSKSELAEKLMSVFEESLYKCNVYWIHPLRVLYQNAIDDEKFEEAKQHGTRLLKILSTYQAEKDISLCHFKYGFAQVLKRINEKENCEEMLTPVREVYGKVFGAKSQIYHNVELMLR